jgi:hypothetical protein
VIDASNRYTIQAERDVHRRVLGGAAPATGDGGGGGNGGDSGLGDNVELF